MYLFTRRTRLAGGNAAEGVAWAASVAMQVKEVTGQEIRLWSTVYSQGFGTISWTGWFADLTSLEAIGDKLQANAGMQKLVTEGTKFTDGNLDDALLQTIAGEPDASGPAKYVTGAEAVIAAGNTERAMGVGAEIAQKAESITGLATMFASSLTGPFGGVRWLTGYPDLASMEKAQNALAGDPSWLKLIDSTKGCFVEDPAVSQTTIYRRLA